MSEELKQEEHFVAFLDILGYSNFINSATEEEGNDYLRNIVKAFSEKNFDTFKVFEVFFNHYFDTQLFSEPIIKTKLFSDNILVFVKCVENEIENAKNLAMLLAGITTLQKILLSYNKLLCRGGIVKGLFFENENFVFGKALVEAANYEKKAIYPRIILEKDLIGYYYPILQQDESLRSFIKSLVLKDNDVYFLNYLWLFPDYTGNDDNTIYEAFNCKVKKVFDDDDITTKKSILYMVEKYGNYESLSQLSDIAERHKVILKILWLVDYFNNACRCYSDACYKKLVINYQIINDPIHHLPKIVLLEDEQEEQR